MSNYLPSDYQAFIHTSRYARWLDEENRRENWVETVDRYIDNVVNKILANINYVGSAALDIQDAILSLKVMPSMRARAANMDTRLTSPTAGA